MNNILSDFPDSDIVSCLFVGGGRFCNVHFDLDCKKVEGRFSRIHMYNFTFSNDLMSDCLSTIIFPFQNDPMTYFALPEKFV